MSDILTKNESPVNALLWTREEEELLKDWSDIANRFRWLHERSAFVFRNKNNKIALPVIVISTLTGTANFGINSLVPQSFIQIAQVIIGGANIFCGILTTIQTYFKYAENSESHSNSAKLWAKFHGIISIELAIEPSKRRNPTAFLKFCIEEYNKLKEYSPQILPEIANLFKTTFRKKHIKLPDIFDEINPPITYSDYVSRNIKNKGDESSAPKSPKNNTETIYDKIDEMESGIRKMPSAFNHRPVKEIANHYINSNMPNIDFDNESGISIENNLNKTNKSISKYTDNQKENIKAEIDSIKPNVKSLINSLSKNLGNTIGNSLARVNSNNNDSTDLDKSSPVEKSSIIINNSNTITQLKSNLKSI